MIKKSDIKQLSIKEFILLVTEFAKQRQLEAVNTETLDKVKGHKLKQIRCNHGLSVRNEKGYQIDEILCELLLPLNLNRKNENT